MLGVSSCWLVVVFRFSGDSYWECCCVCALCLLYCLRLYHGRIFVWCLGDVVVSFVGWVLIIYDVVSLWCHWVCIRYVGLWCVWESGCLNMCLNIIIVIGRLYWIDIS